MERMSVVFTLLCNKKLLIPMPILRHHSIPLATGAPPCTAVPRALDSHRTMYFIVRPLVLSLLTLLAAVWFLITRENIGQHLDDWTHQSLRIRPPAPLDARLDPENHALRDAKRIELDWVIRQELRSPDGVRKAIYTVNGPQHIHDLLGCKCLTFLEGLFPGPTIQARSGDRIVLRVHNDLDTETTAIHFHGIRHIGSNSMDGTPGLTQVVYKSPQLHACRYLSPVRDSTEKKFSLRFCNYKPIRDILVRSPMQGKKT